MIKAEKSTKGIKVTIQDQGVGLSDKVKDKLFQPHITNKAAGAGMGLYIAQRLVKLFYQGLIELNNDDGGGCIATVNFVMSDQDGCEQES